VDPKPTGKNKRVKKWGLINRKPSQRIGVGLDRPSLQNSKNATYVRRLKMIVLAPTYEQIMKIYLWLGPFDMKDTLSSSCLGPLATQGLWEHIMGTSL
jgi:hypothetical protein